MRTKPIIAGVVGIVLLMFIAILLIAVRTASPEVTVRHIKSVQTLDTFAVTVQISNGTANDFIFHPFRLEARDGTGWKKVCEFRLIPFTLLRPLPPIRLPITRAT